MYLLKRSFFFKFEARHHPFGAKVKLDSYSLMQLLNAKIQSEEVVGVVSLLPNSLNGKAL